jgi:Domain of unknown function (DUF4365)
MGMRRPELIRIGGSDPGRLAYPSIESHSTATGHHLVFSLKRKNYDDLRIEEFIVPRLLVVVLVPKKDEEWLQHNEAETIIRHCAYWACLRGMEDKKNRAKICIRFPRTNLFTVDALRELMRRVGHKEPL